MAVRIPWDEEETALLIDTYPRVEAGRLPLKEAAAPLPGQLRQRAKRSGTETDTVFRNENGIRMGLRFCGETEADAPAVAAGASRGHYRQDPVPAVNRIRELHAAIPGPAGPARRFRSSG